MNTHLHPFLPSIKVVDGSIVSINNSFKELSGYVDKHVLGSSFSSKLSDIVWNEQHIASLYQLISLQASVQDDLYFEAVLVDGNQFKLPVTIHIQFTSHDKKDFIAYFQAFNNKSRDPITGLPNGWAISSRANYIIDHYDAVQRNFVVIAINVDNFSTINYRYNFDIGDQYLKIVGQLLKQTVTEDHLVIRFSNAKFGVLYENTAGLSNKQFEQQVITVCQSLCDLGNAPVYLSDDIVIRKSFSIGVSAPRVVYDNYHAMEVAAETAIENAKKQSVSSFVLADEKMANSLMAQKLIIDEFPNALAEQQIEVHYQPQYDLQTHQLIGLEALSRWQHPQLGVVAPDVFIGIGEDIGFHFEFDLWVFQQVCQQVMEWQRQQLQFEKVAINVSFKTAEMVNFVDRLQDILLKTGCDVQCLEIEITETAQVNNEQAMRHNIAALQQLGFRIAIDDFGTGYSSLNIIRSYHDFFNVVKLDRSLIEHICNTEIDRLFVAQIIDLGKILKLKVLAEGVETAEQASLLAQLGCHFAQGYYFDKALPKAQVEQRLKKLD
ncbi:putative bifunctional diguanylate cyclase/phosphodiesterase [Shewanella maritima]|uniref:putative bifunctional diguanylate cyclase/phosphodiesterase n=1 Tax=Shewanella maritima TaxID=2520507 RepID=UPI003736262B